MIENNIELEKSRNQYGSGQESPAFERHFSVNQVAELWGLSSDAIRRIFRGEPDVVEIQRNQRDTKRRYATLRIPESVVERVHRKLSIVKYVTK